MNVNSRRIFYLAVIVLFCTIAPLLVFFSRGYRFDTRSLKVFRTGGISISSSPRGSSVFLDKHRLKKTTPTPLINIFPGTYELKITSEGYQSWNDQVSVGENSFTSVHASLLPQIPHSITLNGINQPEVIPSPRPYILSVAAKNRADEPIVLIYDTDKNVQVLSMRFHESNELPLAAWNPSGRYLAISGKKDGLYVVPFPGDRVQPLKFGHGVIDRFIWNEETNDVIYIQDGSLYGGSLQSERSRVIASPGILDIMDTSEGIWAIRSSKTSTTADLLDPLNTNRVLRTVDVPSPSDYFIGNTPSGIFVQDGDSVIMISKNGGIQRTEINSKITSIATIPGNRGSIFSSPVEIWRCNLSGLSCAMLRKYSEPVSVALNDTLDIVFTLQNGVVSGIDIQRPSATLGEFAPFESARSITSIPMNRLAIAQQNSVQVLSIR